MNSITIYRNDYLEVLGKKRTKTKVRFNMVSKLHWEVFVGFCPEGFVWGVVLIAYLECPSYPNINKIMLKFLKHGFILFYIL